MERVLYNPRTTASVAVEQPGAATRAFHRRLPGYEVTPLRELPSLATRTGVGRVLLKDESHRLGLPAFKILGASWATYCTMVDRLGFEPEWASLDDLTRQLAALRPLTLATATDGNHGRAVARMARLFGLEARIFVPAGTAAARIDAIASEGATVTVVDGSYDDAVEMASKEAGPRCLVVSDTAWAGYTDIPRRVIEGYSTIFHEVDEQFTARGLPSPDVVFVQIGVGALAAAVVTHYRQPGRHPTRIVGLEPAGAACVLESVEAGHPVTVPGPHRSMMVGMNCGTPSPLAWPLMRDGIDCFTALDDSRAVEAMRLLADEGVVSGETGCAGAAALLALLTGPGADDARRRLKLDSSSTALILSTEGATDPENWERIVGRKLPA
ncbi:MAG: diaminopropionate ammonia-lyase [Dehalococcoidia bacterium]